MLIEINVTGTQMNQMKSMIDLKLTKETLQTLQLGHIRE